MKKTKILHVTFNMNFGGAEKVIQHLVEGLDQDEFINDVACIDDEIGPLGQTLIDQGHRVISLGRKQGVDLSLIKKLNRLIRKEGYHVIHCHQYSPYLYGVIAAIPTKAKVIFTEHGRFYPDYGTWKRKLINPVLKWFTHSIVAISEATKDALVIHENFPAKSIQVIYNGIEDNSATSYDQTAIRKQWSIPENHIVLGTISRLQPIKNQKLMIESFVRIVNEAPATTLLLVGDGPIKKDLESLAIKLGVDNQVVFTGFQIDPYQFHSIIDIFLLSSFSEGTSMTLLEAMSFSKPSVVTNVGGNPEVIEDEEDGYVIDIAAGSDRFADACLELVTNKKSREIFGKHARHRFLNQFSLEHMVKNYKSFYSSQSKAGC